MRMHEIIIEEVKPEVAPKIKAQAEEYFAKNPEELAKFKDFVNVTNDPKTNQPYDNIEDAVSAYSNPNWNPNFRGNQYTGGISGQKTPGTIKKVAKSLNPMKDIDMTDVGTSAVSGFKKGQGIANKIDNLGKRRR